MAGDGMALGRLWFTRRSRQRSRRLRFWFISAFFRVFALTEIAIPDDLLIVRVDVSKLPLGWDGEVPILRTQEMGDAWVRGGASAILPVPSTIIPDGRNYLLNPAHEDFSAVVFGRSTPFRFDPRLK